MDFGLSPDQIELRAAVRQMARRDLASGYLGRAKSTEFPWEAYRQVARLGVLGLLAGPEHNPLDREDHVAAGLAVEELAYADFNLANAVIPVLLTSSLIARSGTGELKERWLARLVAGQTYLAFGLTEPHSGSDAAALRTTATATAAADGDGYLDRRRRRCFSQRAGRLRLHPPAPGPHRDRLRAGLRRFGRSFVPYGKRPGQPK